MTSYHRRCCFVPSVPATIMPLDTIEDPFELSSYESVKQDFVIFYASRDDDGKMWCPVSYSIS